MTMLFPRTSVCLQIAKVPLLFISAWLILIFKPLRCLPAAAALIVLSACTSSNTGYSSAREGVTFVSSPTRQHVAVLMRTQTRGLGRLWDWLSNQPASGTSLAVIDNYAPYTLASPGKPIIYRRIVFTSTCSPNDFEVRWRDADTLSVGTRCPARMLHPAKTPANGINVAYTQLP